MEQHYQYKRDLQTQYMISKLRPVSTTMLVGFMGAGKDITCILNVKKHDRQIQLPEGKRERTAIMSTVSVRAYTYSNQHV